MDDVVARDPRVEAILTRPDDYFDRARSRAWAEAGRDILNDLGRWHTRHRDGGASSQPRPDSRRADLGDDPPPT